MRELLDPVVVIASTIAVALYVFMLAFADTTTCSENIGSVPALVGSVPAFAGTLQVCKSLGWFEGLAIGTTTISAIVYFIRLRTGFSGIGRHLVLSGGGLLLYVLPTLSMGFRGGACPRWWC